MDIQDILKQCIDAGIRLAENDGQMRVHYDDKAPDAELLALLKEHKTELLRHLRVAPSVSHIPLPILSAAARREVFATPAQRRMWLIDRFEKSAAPYNMVGAFRLEGHFSLEALASAVDQTISRHEALGTSFEERDGELFQRVQPSAPLHWERLDVSSLEVQMQDVALRELLQRENQRRFDMANGPLIHVATLRLSDHAAVFVINVHHIACDGWSIGILIREISEAYLAWVDKRTPEWTVPLQYIDHAEWQRNQSKDVALAVQLDNCVRQLKGLPQLHSLPLDKPRPPIQSYVGRSVRRSVADDALRAIRLRCEARDVSLFCFMHMAFSSLVSLYSNERDIVVGFPLAGRRHRNTDATVGLFVNTAVLRSKIDGDVCFDALLAQSRDDIRHAIAHQDVQYETLLEALKPDRSRAHGPLVQLLLTVQSATEAELVLPGVQVERLDNPEEPVKFDLQLEVTEWPTRLEICWRFNADLFDSASIERMADGFEQLTGLAALDGNATLHDVVGSTIAMSGPPAASLPQRLDTLFEAHARQYPDDAAVVFQSDRLSYGELDARANLLAQQLRGLGAGTGTRVGLCIDRSIELVVGILGTLKAGAAYVPLDMSNPTQRLATMIADCDATVLLGQRHHAPLMTQFGRRMLFLDEPALHVTDDWNSSVSDAAVPGRMEGDVEAPAYVIYTSGTTGMPKGVVVPHSSVSSLLAHYASLAPMQSPWNGSLWSSINFDASVIEIFSALCGGGCLHIVPDSHRLDAERLFAWMADCQINSSYLYAGYLESFGRHLSSPGAQSALTRMLVGVEPISSEHLDAISSRIPTIRIINGYGPTEATICCTMHQYEPTPLAPARRVPIGRAVAGAKLYVMNGAGKPSLPGALGELYVGGTCLALGYLNNPDLTRERFVEKCMGATNYRLYRTGDIVRSMPSGELEFIGRADEQVKIRGFRIEPGEIEVRLCAQDEVGDAAVLALGEGRDKHLVAYVVPKVGRVHGQEGDGQCVVDRIRRALKDFLPDYMIPADIVLLDAIPMTTNGKVDRAALPIPVRSSADTARGKVAPRDDIERQLVEIWKEVLSHEEIGITDDFFALGGHSLHVTRLVSRLRHQFALSEAELPLEMVFESPSVERLAVALSPALRRSDAKVKEAYLSSLGDSVEEGVL